jgi:ubiquinone/menaquinone biosynthesis C-methylase UbiE
VLAGIRDRVSFDLLAPHYTWMERVLAGPRLQRARTAWLEQLTSCDRILIAGVGHGHFLRACAKRFPHARIVSVDASAGMLSRAQAGVPNQARLEFVHAQLPQWLPTPQSFDAVVTHFFLDCFPPDALELVITGLSQSLRPRARWLVTDFSIPARGWKRQRARAIHSAMYAFFRPIAGVRANRVTPPDDFLRREGFVLTGRAHREWGLIQSDLWSRD